MGVKDDFTTGSLLSQAAQAASMVASPGHLCDMFNGMAFPKLSNGVSARVRTVPDAAYSTIHVLVAAGARNDPPGKEGTAHLLEHMIFSQDEKTMREIDVTLKARGGQIKAFTNQGWTRYELRVLNDGDNMDYATRLLSRAVFAPQFDPEQVAREKIVVLDEARLMQDREGKDVANVAIHLALGSQPSVDSVLGDAETLAGISPQDLTDFRRAHYTGPNVTVEYTGPEKPLAAVTMIQKYFGGLPSHGPPKFEEKPLLDTTHPGGREEVKHDPVAAQTAYALSIPFTLPPGNMEERQVLAAYLDAKIHETMRGGGDRHAYFQKVMMMGDGKGKVGITLTGNGAPEAASLALRSFAGHLRELMGGRIDTDILAAAIGSVRMERARSTLHEGMGDMNIERPEILRARKDAADYAYTTITAEKLTSMVRNTLVCSAPGLCLHGNTEGVARLADILPLLPKATPGLKIEDRNIA